MRTMSLYESGESNGSVSLRNLFDNKMPVMEPSNLTIEQIAFALCRGGWPASVRMKEEDAMEPPATMLMPSFIKMSRGWMVWRETQNACSCYYAPWLAI